MPKVTYVLADGSRRSLGLSVGASLMEGATGNAIPGVLGDCGGSCACATCHVYIEDARAAVLPPPSEMENELLNGVAAERRPTSRLGCQVRVTAELDGLVVVLPERQT
jgi:2Fe-2S ferredoxin